LYNREQKRKIVEQKFVELTSEIRGTKMKITGNKTKTLEQKRKVWKQSIFGTNFEE
jgi:hypothetical protein